MGDARQKTTVGSLRRDARDTTTGGIVLGPNQVRVDRGSIFGNPFWVGGPSAAGHGSLEEVLVKYTEYLAARIRNDPDFWQAVLALKGRELLCWCRPVEGFAGKLRCHAQVLAACVEGCRPEEID